MNKLIIQGAHKSIKGRIARINVVLVMLFLLAGLLAAPASGLSAAEQSAEPTVGAGSHRCSEEGGRCRLVYGDNLVRTCRSGVQGSIWHQCSGQSTVQRAVDAAILDAG